MRFAMAKGVHHRTMSTSSKIKAVLLVVAFISSFVTIQLHRRLANPPQDFQYPAAPIDKSKKSKKSRRLRETVVKTNDDGNVGRLNSVQRNFHIFQIGLPHTGSTLLNCILQGLVEDLETSLSFLPKRSMDLSFGKTSDETLSPFILQDGVLKPTNENINRTLVTKTHILDIDKLDEKLGPLFDHTFYIVSNRASKNLNIEVRFCEYPNVLCIDYDEFSYKFIDHERNSILITTVVEKVKAAMTTKFPYFREVEMNVENAVKRIQLMDKVTKEMAQESFQTFENRFGIHGGHVNRNDNVVPNPIAVPTGDERKLHFIHLVPIARAEDCEIKFCPFDQAQTIAIASMQRARETSNDASVTLATSLPPEDEHIVPHSFSLLSSLEQSRSTNNLELSGKKRLPSISFKSHVSARNLYDYVIYTGSDVILHEEFYDIVSTVIEHGNYDAFAINGQLISNGIIAADGSFRLYNDSDLDKIFALNGEEHPVSNCFVFKQSIFDRIDIGDLFLGSSHTGDLLLEQAKRLAERFTMFASNELKATYFMGNHREWKDNDSKVAQQSRGVNEGWGSVNVYFGPENQIQNDESNESKVTQQRRGVNEGWGSVNVYFGPENQIQNEGGSQAKQDAIVLDLMSSLQSNTFATSHHKTTSNVPYFIDLAANDAILLSNTIKLERAGWEGLCIEPNPIYYHGLSRRKCDVVGAFVGGMTDGSPVKVSLSNGVLGGIVGESFDNKEGHGPLSIRHTVSLRTVFKKFDVPKIIDYMSLDVEGAESLIMKDFPFEEYIIRFITIERPKADLKLLLENKAYRFVGSITNWGETVWVHSSILRQLSLNDIKEIILRHTKLYDTRLDNIQTAILSTPLSVSPPSVEIIPSEIPTTTSKQSNAAKTKNKVIFNESPSSSGQATMNPMSPEISLLESKKSENSIPPRPTWLEEYITFHRSSITTNGKGGYQLKDNVPFIVYECSGENLCGGIGDRVYSMVMVLYLAMCSGRVLLIHSPYPSPLENFLKPNEILWNVTSPDLHHNDLPMFDLMDARNHMLNIDPAIVGYRLGRTNGMPARHTLKSIWSNRCMVDYFNRIDQPFPYPSNLPEEKLLRWSFWSLFTFSNDVLSRAEVLKHNANLHMETRRRALDPYIGIHIRTGDKSMGIEKTHTGQRMQGTTRQQRQFLQCYRRFRSKMPHVHHAYLASDSVKAKEVINGWDSSIHFADETTIFHVDQSLRIDGAKTTTPDEAAYLGSLDAWAELVVLVDSECLIMSQSSFSFAAHFVRGESRCGIFVGDCTKETVGETYVYAYERGPSPMVIVEKK